MKNYFLLALAVLCSMLIGEAKAGLIAGDIAVIGWIDNGSPDSFIFVSLADIPAGSDVYFTDNGWTGTKFRGAGTDGDGNENLVKWTAVNAIPAGTIVNSTSSSPDYLWTTSGAVPGAASGSFGNLAIGGSGEQICAFLGPLSNPLNSPATYLYLFDDTGAFEPAVDSSTGDIPPGLSASAHTAVTLNLSAGNVIYFNTSALSSGTKEEWLAAIDDLSHWTSAASGTLPSGTINVVPEPPTLLSLFFAICAGGWFGHRRQRLAQ